MTENEQAALADIKEQIDGPPIDQDLTDTMTHGEASLFLRSGENWIEPRSWVAPPTAREFPIEALPDTMRNAVTTLAENIRGPIEVAIVHGFAVVSAATSGRIVADIWDGWEDYPAVYGITFTPSGARKTPMKNAIEKAVHEAWGTWGKFHEREKYESEAKVKFAEKDVNGAEKSYEVDPSAVALDELTRMKQRLREAEEQVVVLPNPLATDATTQALAVQMERQNDMAFVAESESTFLSNVAGRYSGSPDTGLVNAGWTVTEPMRYGRIGRDDVDLDHPFIAMGIHVQSDLAIEYAGIQQFIETGFLARPLIARPGPVTGRTGGRPPPVDAAAMGSWSGVISSLVERSWGLRPEDSVRLAFTDEASQLVSDEENRYAINLEENSYPDHIGSWLAKRHGHIVRIATLISLVENPGTNEVGLSAVERAVTIIDYFEYEVFRFFDEVVKAGGYGVALEATLTWVANQVNQEEGGGPARLTFGQSEAHQAVRKTGGGDVSSAEFKAVIQLGVEYGWLREIKSRSNRRDSFAYCAHPSVPDLFGTKAKK